MANKDPFRSRQVPESVAKEFEARGDGEKVLKWTSTRTPWIYALTCAGGACGEAYNEFGNDPTTVPGARKMFGVNQSVAAYEQGSNIPLPYIEELSVKAIGSLGTTRKAVMKVKCHRDEHLIELQKCWFIPGMDVRVQWGWSLPCAVDEYGKLNKGFVLDDQNFPCDKLAAAAICKINKKRKERPDYDGFQGIVTNYSYNLDKDNTWNVEIEVISAADPFSDSKIANDSCGCKGTTNTDQGEVKKDYGPMYEFLSSCYSGGVFAASRGIAQCARAFGDSPRSKHWCAYSYNYFGVERTETGGEKEGSWWDDIFDGEETIETWISLGLFVDLLNTYAIPHNPGAGKDKAFPYGNIDISEVLLPVHSKRIFGADPRKIYIYGFGKDGIDPNDWKEGGTKGSAGPGNDFAYVSAASAGKSGPSSGYVQLSKIMCNTIWLNQVYKQNYDGTGTLKGLIDSILREINSLCGSPWEFTTTSTSEDCGDDGDDTPSGPTITLLDARSLQSLNAPYVIPSTIGKSTLREFGLKMKMTSAMKTQALYANNHQKAKGDNGAGCTGTAVKPFYSQGADSVVNKAKPKPGKAKTNCGDCDEGADGGPSFYDVVNDFKEEINDQTAGTAQQWINKHISEANDDSAGCGGVMLPFDFSFTVDGIGGFEFGQKVSSDRIPKAIRKNLQWQITKVEHKINKSDWETTVSTVCRANPKGSDEKFDQAQPD